MSARPHELRAALPMAATRPADRHVGRRKSPDRVAVESVLRTATRDEPLSAIQVARRAGVSAPLTRTLINNLCQHGFAHNTTPGRMPAMYAAGPAPLAPVDTPKQRRVNSGDYDGHDLQPFTARPGAMDAFDLPSLQQGVRVPRRPPIIISGNPEGRR